MKKIEDELRWKQTKWNLSEIGVWMYVNTNDVKYMGRVKYQSKSIANTNGIQIYCMWKTNETKTIMKMNLT